MGTTGKSFLQFQVSRRADLSRIARKSGGDHSADDAGVEAWLIANDIERKRGFPVDFSNSEDQDLVLSWLYRELVSFSERTVRFALKIDKHWQEDSEFFTNSLEGLLVAPDQFDPLLRLLASGAHMRSQPSLFDKIQTIENDFVPSVARYVVRAPVCEPCQQQLEWEFV